MIVIFGALNVDIMMPVKSFPEGGETVLCSRDYVTRPGGKGSNQAIAAIKSEAKVAVIGKIGDDSFGRRSQRNLKKQGVLTAGLGVSDRPTGCSTIVVDKDGHNIVMTASGANLETSSDQVPDEILTDKNILMATLELNREQTKDVLRRAKIGGCTTILNASPINEIDKEILFSIDYLIANEIEARKIARLLNLEERVKAKAIAKTLSDDFDLSAIITLEERGAIACRDGVLYQIPALNLAETVDSTGAGDTFCGIFAACLQKNMSWINSMHYASAGAGISCMGFGAQNSIPSFEEIEEKLSQVKPPEAIG